MTQIDCVGERVREYLLGELRRRKLEPPTYEVHTIVVDHLRDLLGVTVDAAHTSARAAP
ncbi:hypothetical protein [Nocardia sp. NPDC058666]|uniref:hypothetical protein n=1 Tax=Nocardia sp. NPDC058666 TaxID=3346587 RepID=UPI00365D174F